MSPLHSPGLLSLYLGLAEKLQPITQTDPSATADAVNVLSRLYSGIYADVLQLLPGLRVEQAAVNMLHLAAPSVLQLAYICFTSCNRLQLKPEAFEPESTFDLLQASSLAKGLLPALWQKHPKFADTSSSETTVWLEQQPAATLAAIRSSFFSTGFSWFLWDVVGSATAGLHHQCNGVSPACGLGVPGDHAAFASPTGTTLLPPVAFTQVENYILDCLEFIHLIQPAEQVTIWMLSQQQQQQQQEPQQQDEEEEEGAAVAGSTSLKKGREAWGLNSSSSSGDDLDSSSQRDQDGIGSGAATISSSGSGSGRSSSQHDQAQDNSGSSSGRSDGIGGGSSRPCSAAAGEAGGRGGGVNGVGDGYDGRQRRQAGTGTEKKQGPTVEWLLLAAGSCTSGAGSSSGTAVTRQTAMVNQAAAVSPAAASAREASAMSDGQRKEEGLASPGKQGVGCVCGPGAAGEAGVAGAAGAAEPEGASGAARAVVTAWGARATGPAGAAGPTQAGAAAAPSGTTAEPSAARRAGAPPAPAPTPAAGAPVAGAAAGPSAATAAPAGATAVAAAAGAGAPPAPTPVAVAVAGAAAAALSAATAAPAGATVTAAAPGPSAAIGVPTASGASRQTEPEPEAALDVTANQLKLLLELLLLKWPCPQNQVYTMMGTVEVAAIMSAHDWLLLLAALLQQAPAAAKLQLLEERGTLLLQLLYEVMLDEDSGRSRHAEVNTRPIAAYSSGQASVLLRELATAVRQGQRDDPSSSIASSAGRSSSSSSRAGPVKPVSLVLLVLQNLLYEAVPLSVVEEMPLLPGRMLSLGEYKHLPL